MCVYAWVSIPTHIFTIHTTLRGSKSNDNPVAISTLGAQILISKYHSAIKGTKDP